MSNDLQTLRSLLEQAAAHRDQALGAHRQSLAALQAAQTQAEQLAGYKADYVQRFGGGPQGKRPTTIETLQCYQGFMARLDDALRQQTQQVVQSAQRAELAKGSLLAAEMRVSSVHKLIERRSAEAATQAERREQKTTDEFASRRAWQQMQAAGADGLGWAT